MIEEKELSLSAIFTVIWERGKRILLFTGICMVLAAIGTKTIQDRYESTATLLMNKSKIGERTMMNPSIPMKTYEELFFPKGILLEVIKEHSLNGEPYNFAYPESLQSRINVTYVEETSIVNISVQLEDSQKASDVANSLADHAIATVNKLVQMEQDTSTVKMGEQGERIYQDALAYRDIYLKSLKKNLMPLQIQTVGNYMSMYAKDMQEKENLDSSIIELEVRKEKFEEIFSATSDFKQKVELRRAVVTDPLLVERIRQQKGEDVSLDDLSDIVFVEEQMNVYYNQIFSEYQKLLVDLPAMIARRDFLAGRTEELKQLAAENQSVLSEMGVEELLTKGDFDRAMEIFSGINKETGWAGTTVAAERQDLVPVYPAVPNPKKVYPRRSLMVGLTGMSAFLLAFLYYLLIDLYGLVKLQTRREDV